ncbi:MAG: VCBS repeat-containing protein [Thermoanaerobaculia bacterium]|nr:VCBS repeat-containing protein [Thermoanaerobaculia bacterium]
MNDAPVTLRTAAAGPSFAAHLGALLLGLGSLVLALGTPALAQWSTQSPLPTHLEVHGVAAPAPGRVFLATDDDSFDASGALFESNDGGGTWIQRDVPESLGDGLNGIFFFDDQRGWAWGNSNYRTTDGGTTWEPLPLLGSAYFMEFYSASFGVTTGNFGAYVSRDGGLTWTPSPEEMIAFDFADALTGLGVSGTGLYRTTDGGDTFALVQAGAADAVAFLTPTVAVAIVDGTLLRSADGGLTWAGSNAAEGRNALLAVAADVALAWGRSGTHPDYDDRIFRSADGGETWTDLGEVIDPGPFAVGVAFALPAASIVVASDGAGNLHRSTDAGLTWTQTFATPGPAPGFLGSAVPVFTDPQTGYFGYGPGFVLRTTDGGASWHQISSGSGTELRDLDRFANGDRIAVGQAGQVLTSAGSSAAWLLRATLTPASLEAVQVIGPQEAVAVDGTGRVYRSTDGGASWTASASAPPELAAVDLHFATGVDGWVIGQGFASAALFHTVDAGATWVPVTDFLGTYVAVDFAGPSGWAASYDGTFYRTTDSGLSWTQGSLPGLAPQVKDLDFWDSAIGYAVGGGGYAVRSTDGGASWQLLPTPSADDQLVDIALVGPSELWVATAGGHALYSANGGANWAVMDAGPAGFGAFAAIAANPAGDAWIAGWQGAIRHFSGPPPPPVNQPPAAAFNFSTTGLSVAFTDSSSDNDGTIASWLWSFDDGSTSTERHPTHLFAAAGTYIVALTVTDDDGDSDVAGHAVVVQPGPGGTFGDFTEVTPLDPLFVTPQDEDFWVATTAPADYDGDGDLDIAVLGYYVVYNTSVEEMMVLLRNDGPPAPDAATEWNFSYIDVPLGTVTVGASDLAWGDVDSDGDQDLALGSEGQTVIYRNDAGTLVPTDTILPGYWEDNDQADFDLNSISWADYDNDGDLDLLLPSIWNDETFTSRTALMRNDGSNGSGGWLFTEEATDFGRSNHMQSSWADFDGDQDLDLLLVHIAPLTETGFIHRFRNDGNGVFVGEEILGTLTVEHGEAQWGDYDDDGDLDILVAGNVKEIDDSYNTVLRLYRNDAESFVPVELMDCVFCEGWFDLTAAYWADYDSDGDVDILLAGTYNSGSQIEGRAKVLDNDGGVFSDSGNQLPAPRAMGFSGGSFSWLDIDGEGDLDYFIAGSYFVPGGNGLIETQMHLYLNDSVAENLAPTAPSLLDSQVLGDNSVDLWWSPAEDDLTPAQALTYELRLYRDGVPVSTARRSPEPGNLSVASEWTLSGLAEGSYTWTLEAVDSAFNPGPAASAAFVIGTPPAPVFTSGFETGDATGWSVVLP